MSIIYDALKKVEPKTSDIKKETVGPQPNKPKLIRLVPAIYILIAVVVLVLVVVKFFLHKQPKEAASVVAIADKAPSIAQRLPPKQGSSPSKDLPTVTKKPPPLSVSGIFLSGGKYSALINNREVGVGDSIRGVQIDRIDFDGVQISFEGSSWKLNYP
jgi:hypothetical protein